MKKIHLLLFTCLFSVIALAQEPAWVAASAHKKSEGQKVILHNNETYVLGCYHDSLSFNTPNGTFNRFIGPTLNYQRSFLTKFDNNKNIVWCHDLPFANKLRYGLYASNFGVTPLVDFEIKNSSIYTIGNLGDTTGLVNNSSLKQFSGYQKFHIAKFDLNMNLDWKIQLGDSSDVLALNIAVDDSENIYCLGYFRDSIDFDPSGNTNYLIGDSTGYYYSFIASYDSIGNLRWAFRYNYGFDNLNMKKLSFEINNDEININFYAEDTIDLDPTAGVYNYTDIDKNIIVSYSTNDGHFKRVLTLSSLIVQNILPFEDKVFFGGVIYSNPPGDTVYFDSPNTNYPLITSSINDAYIGCIDTLGNILWVKNFQANLQTDIKFNDIDIYNNAVVFSGSLNSESIDFDASSSVALNYAMNFYEFFMATYDFSGNYLWHYNTNADSRVEISDVFIDEQQNKILSTGLYSGSFDFDCDTITTPLFSGHNSTPGAFIIEYGIDSCAFLHSQITNTSAVTCTQQGNASLNIVGGIPPYDIQWNTNPIASGVTSTPIDTGGVYSVMVTDNMGCSDTKYFFIDGPTSYTDIDLSSYLVSGIYFPGYTNFINVIGKNESCVPVNGTLETVLDPQLIYISADITPDQISGDTLRWNFTNLIEDSLISISVKYMTSTSAQTGDTIRLESYIYPFTNDTDTSNNYAIVLDSVVNSFDPNDISVSPAGDCLEHFIDKNEKLTYTIRFQNTGNTAALNVNIIDTLNQYLDISTFNIIASSHPFINEISNDKVFKFLFENINLPDSNTSYELSQGYIIYEINPLATAPNYTLVENKADIFFDFNLPVTTNTVFNTLVASVVNCNLSIDEPVSNLDFRIYPNPAKNNLTIALPEALMSSTVEIMDIQGKIIESVLTSAKLTTLNISELSNGLYFIRISSENGSGTMKFVKE